jgi:hypothetical protein
MAVQLGTGKRRHEARVVTPRKAREVRRVGREIANDHRACAGGVTVVLGSTVRVRDTDGEHEHTVVGRVTVGAPTGMRLRRVTAGHGCAQAQASDEVEVHTCSGVRLLTVVAVATVAVPPSPRSARTCEG